MGRSDQLGESHVRTDCRLGCAVLLLLCGAGVARGQLAFNEVAAAPAYE